MENYYETKCTIIDPLHPDRGLRIFKYNEELGKYIDSEDPRRIVKFVCVFGRCWRRSGNEHLGKKVLRLSYDEFGRISERIIYTVEGWLPESESDFVNDSGNPAPLWRACDCVDDAIDLEEAELLDGRAAFFLQEGLKIHREISEIQTTEGRMFWHSAENYTKAVVIWSGDEPEVVSVQRLFALNIKVSQVDSLWTDQTLCRFLQIEHPYKYCDCIPEYSDSHSQNSHPSFARKRGRPRNQENSTCLDLSARTRQEEGQGGLLLSLDQSLRSGLAPKQKRGRPRTRNREESQSQMSCSKCMAPASSGPDQHSVEIHRQKSEHDDLSGGGEGCETWKDYDEYVAWSGEEVIQSLRSKDEGRKSEIGLLVRLRMTEDQRHQDMKSSTAVGILSQVRQTESALVVKTEKQILSPSICASSPLPPIASRRSLLLGEESSNIGGGAASPCTTPGEIRSGTVQYKVGEMRSDTVGEVGKMRSKVGDERASSAFLLAYAGRQMKAATALAACRVEWFESAMDGTSDGHVLLLVVEQSIAVSAVAAAVKAYNASAALCSGSRVQLRRLVAIERSDAESSAVGGQYAGGVDAGLALVRNCRRDSAVAAAAEFYRWQRKPAAGMSAGASAAGRGPRGEAVVACVPGATMTAVRQAARGPAVAVAWKVDAGADCRGALLAPRAVCWADPNA